MLSALAHSLDGQEFGEIINSALSGIDIGPQTLLENQ